MTQIYRVQDSEGRGPYRPGKSYRWTDEDHYRNPPFYVEFGWTVGSIAKRWHAGEVGGCGFRSIEALKHWFSDSERSKLDALGYSIVSMKADRIIAESRNQLVFARRTPLWADYLMVPWPDASTARTLELSSTDRDTPS
jgi:hypothetical protein